MKVHYDDWWVRLKPLSFRLKCIQRTAKRREQKERSVEFKSSGSWGALTVAKYTKLISDFIIRHDKGIRLVAKTRMRFEAFQIPNYIFRGISYKVHNSNNEIAYQIDEWIEEHQSQWWLFENHKMAQFKQPVLCILFMPANSVHFTWINFPFSHSQW